MRGSDKFPYFPSSYTSSTPARVRLPAIGFEIAQVHLIHACAGSTRRAPAAAPTSSTPARVRPPYETNDPCLMHLIHAYADPTRREAFTRYTSSTPARVRQRQHVRPPHLIHACTGSTRAGQDNRQARPPHPRLLGFDGTALRKPLPIFTSSTPARVRPGVCARFRPRKRLIHTCADPTTTPLPLWKSVPPHPHLHKSDGGAFSHRL